MKKTSVAMGLLCILSVSRVAVVSDDFNWFTLSRALEMDLASLILNGIKA